MRELVAAATHGDDAAWWTFHARSRPYVQAVVLRHLPANVRTGADVEDVVQDAFVRICTGLKGFDYRGPNSLAAWVRCIALSAAIDATRFRSRVRRSDPDALASAEGGHSVVETGASDVDLQLDVTAAVQCLPGVERRVIRLRWFEGRSWNEVARATGCPLRTCKEVQAWAFRDLRRILGGWRPGR